MFGHHDTNDTRDGAQPPIQPPIQPPTQGPGQPPPTQVLDEVMPSWTSREYHSVAMPAVASDVMQAAEQLTWREVPGFRAIITLAGMGKTPVDPAGKVLNLLLDGPYEIIHHSPAELVVVGILPLSPDITLPQLGADPIASYRELRQPRTVKVAANFLLRDGVLSTETRNSPVGRKATVLFAVYWAMIRAGSGLIRRSWLKGIRQRALIADSILTAQSP